MCGLAGSKRGMVLCMGQRLLVLRAPCYSAGSDNLLQRHGCLPLLLCCLPMPMLPGLPAIFCPHRSGTMCWTGPASSPSRCAVDWFSDTVACSAV